MAKKKQFVTAAAAFAVAASAVAPAITADAATQTVRLKSDFVRVGNLDATLDKEYKGSEIYWYKSSVDMNKLGVFQTAKGFVKGKGIRVEKRVRVLNHAQEIKPASEFVFEQGVPVSGIRIQPVLFADGVEYNKPLFVAGFSTEKVGEFEGTLTYSNKAYGTVTKKVKYQVVSSVPKLEDVKATAANKVVVNFSTPIADVDHTNFEVSGGLTVVKATLSSDKKSVELELAGNVTSQMKYDLTATGIKSTSGKEAEALKGSFVWAVSEGVTISLDKMTLDANSSEQAEITVNDVDGKEITDAVIDVTSSNTNIVDDAGENITAVAPGSAEVTVKATLKDGTVITNTFKVNVTKVEDVVQNQGITLVDDVTTDAPDNTVAFNNGTKVTSLFNSEVKEVAMFNTTNGDPDGAPVNFTGATVKSLNPTIATADVAGAVLTVTADSKQVGKASFEVTLADKTKKTFSVDVKETAELKDIAVNATSVKLSDEHLTASTFEEGVNQKTVNITPVDQYGNSISFGSAGKVTVSSNTEGLVLGGVDSTDSTVDMTSGEFTISSTKDKIVNGRVEVKYFKNASDTKPTSTKVINVNIVDVDPSKTVKTSLEVIAANEIDANADYTATSSDVKSVDYSSDATVYVLDQKGNRVDLVEAGVTATAVDAKKDTDWVGVTSNTVGFDAGALNYLSQSGSIKVNVTADGITTPQTVNFKNSAMVPHKAMVATSPVAIKLNSADAGISLEEILFGALDSAQLAVDSDDSIIMAVKKAAKNGGYLYNKPLVSATDVNGKSIYTGANVYGLASSATLGNVWTVAAKHAGATGFEVDYSLANWSSADGVTAPTGISDDITLSSGEAVTFTLVVRGIKTEADANGKEDANLLAAPVSINVTLTK